MLELYKPHAFLYIKPAWELFDGPEIGDEYIPQAVMLFNPYVSITAISVAQCSDDRTHAACPAHVSVSNNFVRNGSEHHALSWRYVQSEAQLT